jgi:hypothetical protein
MVYLLVSIFFSLSLPAELSMVLATQLDEMDYDATTSSTVQMPDNESNSTRISRVTAYAPRTFSDLRSRFGIDEEEFERVMTNDGPYVSFQSNSKGAARAGKSCHSFLCYPFWVVSLKQNEGDFCLMCNPLSDALPPPSFGYI